MDRSNLVAGYGLAALAVGGAVVAWGYRTDRKGVPFPWDRYWHWWRVSIVYGMIAATSLLPIAWLIYWGRPPDWTLYLTGGFFPILVFTMGFSHWRLWFPILGIGRPFLGSYMPRQVYIRQSLRTFGYSLGLGLAGLVVVFLLGRMVSG